MNNILQRAEAEKTKQDRSACEKSINQYLQSCSSRLKTPPNNELQKAYAMLQDLHLTKLQTNGHMDGFELTWHMLFVLACLSRQLELNHDYQAQSLLESKRTKIKDYLCKIVLRLIEDNRTHFIVHREGSLEHERHPITQLLNYLNKRMEEYRKHNNIKGDRSKKGSKYRSTLYTELQLSTPTEESNESDLVYKPIFKKEYSDLYLAIRRIYSKLTPERKEPENNLVISLDIIKSALQEVMLDTSKHMSDADKRKYQLIISKNVLQISIMDNIKANITIDALISLAQTLRQQDDFDNAIEIFDGLRSMLKMNVEAFVGRLEFQNRAIAKAEIKLARAYYGKVMQTHPITQQMINVITHSDERTSELADDYVLDQQMNENIIKAITVLQTCLELLNRPSSTDIKTKIKAEYHLARCYFLQGKFKQTTEVSERAIRKQRYTKVVIKRAIITELFALLALSSLANKCFLEMLKAVKCFLTLYRSLDDPKRDISDAFLLAFMSFALSFSNDTALALSCCRRSVAIFNKHPVFSLSVPKQWIVLKTLILFASGLKKVNKKEDSDTYLDICEHQIEKIIGNIGDNHDLTKSFQLLANEVAAVKNNSFSRANSWRNMRSRSRSNMSLNSSRPSSTTVSLPKSSLGSRSTSRSSLYSSSTDDITLPNGWNDEGDDVTPEPSTEEISTLEVPDMNDIEVEEVMRNAVDI